MEKPPNISQQQIKKREESPEDFSYFKKTIELTQTAKMEFRSGAPANLFYHTLNIYGFLGNHGTEYGPEINNKSIHDASNKEIKDRLIQKRGDIYDKEEKFVRTFINTDPQNVGALINTFAKSEDPDMRLLSTAMRDSWEKYEPYFSSQASKFKETTLYNMETLPWSEWAEKMERVTGSTFNTNMVTVTAEPLIGSAMYLRPNVCIGSIWPGNDMGFVHEGLHLLLDNEAWANDQRIKDMMPKDWRSPDIERYPRWQSYFEQAVVISLDCSIRNREPYFDGCSIGSLEQYFYEPIKQWYVKKIEGATEDMLTDVIYKILSEHKAELVDQTKEMPAYEKPSEQQNQDERQGP